MFNSTTTRIPVSNTVTALEVWLLACMLLVFLSLVEYAVILRQIVIYKRWEISICVGGREIIWLSDLRKKDTGQGDQNPICDYQHSTTSPGTVNNSNNYTTINYTSSHVTRTDRQTDSQLTLFRFPPAPARSPATRRGRRRTASSRRSAVRTSLSMWAMFDSKMYWPLPSAGGQLSPQTENPQHEVQGGEAGLGQQVRGGLELGHD